MRPIALELIRREVRRRLGLSVPPYPRRVRITAFDASGCRFEITGPTEAFRVERFGDEEENTRHLVDQIRSDDVVFDVGACIGMIAVHAAAKGAHVVAFEPDPSYRRRLQRNLRLNRLHRRVRVEPMAITDRVGPVTLFTDGVEGWSPSLGTKGGRGSVEVPGTTVDAYVAASGLRPTILKVDIEGAEGQALEGASRTLAGDHPPRLVFLELHPEYLPQFATTREAVLKHLTEAGYEPAQQQVRGAQEHWTFRPAGA